MNWILQEYVTLFIYFSISFILSFILIGLTFVYHIEDSDLEAFLTKSKDNEKLSAYGCGFEAFNDARSRFNVHYYIVGMLFLIFDLEIIFMFPWAVQLNFLGILGFWTMMFFLFVLLIGFIYEWKKGALAW